MTPTQNTAAPSPTAVKGAAQSSSQGVAPANFTAWGSMDIAVHTLAAIKLDLREVTL